MMRRLPGLFLGLPLALLFVSTAFGQISITAPIPNFGPQSIEIRVTTPTMYCTYTVITAPTMFRTCYKNNKVTDADTINYSVLQNLNSLNLPYIIEFAIDKDASGHATYQIDGSAGHLGPVEFPGQ